MTSNRNLLGVALTMIIAVACTEAEAAQPPPAPPDVFAPTPTIGDNSPQSTTSTTRPEPTTTTSIDIEQTALYKVDSATLEARPEFDPIPVGDYFWGSASNNRKWLAGRAEDESGGLADVRLIDVENWEVVASWQLIGYGELHVTDEGAVYYAQGGPSWPTLKRLMPGAEVEVAAELPEGFAPSGQFHQHGPLMAVFGTTADWDGNNQSARIATVDLTSGEVAEIELANVTVGIVEEVDIGQEWSPSVGAYPAVVWDEERALIVHADQDVLTEVHLAGGQVTDHRFGPEASKWGSLFAWLAAPAQAGGMPYADSTRSAALSPDGLLYVATRVGEAVVESADDWYLRTDSVGLVVVDTRTWARVDHLDAPIGEVHISPDGTRLLAWGFTQEDRLSTTTFDSHGIFVIDASTLEVLAQHQGPDEWYSPISFSADGRYGYVPTWANTNVIDLQSGDLVRARRGSGIQLWGEVGVIADVNRVP